MAEPNVVAPPADAPAQNNGVTRQIKMDIYAPPVFHDRCIDDALSFLQYVERYAVFKQMNETEKLQLSPYFIEILQVISMKPSLTLTANLGTGSNQHSCHGLDVPRPFAGATQAICILCLNSSTNQRKTL